MVILLLEKTYVGRMSAELLLLVNNYDEESILGGICE